MKNILQLFLKKVLFNTVLYKACVAVIFMLIPTALFCFAPQGITIVMLLWGAALLLHDLFTQRNFLKPTGSILLLLFILGYFITVCFFSENDLVSTINVYCWTIIEFFLLLAVRNGEKKDARTLLQEVYYINIGVSGAALFAAVTSLICFFCRITIVMPDPEGLNQYWSFGIANTRNSGIFNNPIPLASAMYLGCIASFYNLLFNKKMRLPGKLFYILTAIICTICMQTTMTRTYIVGLYLLIALAAFIGGYNFFSARFKVFKTVMCALLATVVFTGAALGCVELSKKGMTLIVSNTAPHIYILGYDNESSSSTDPSENPDVSIDETEKEISDKLGLGNELTLNRDEIKRMPNFFYPRNELWKVGLQVIPHSSVLGVTTGNLASSSLQYGNTEYFNKYWTDGIPTYHNAYFDVAISAGLLGLVLLLGFVILQILRTVKMIFLWKKERISVRGMACYGILAAYLAVHIFFVCLFFGTLVFCNLAVCLYFWITLGYVSQINNLELGNGNLLSCDSLLNKILKKASKTDGE